MPRFYFNIREDNETTRTDLEGIEIRDLNTAAQEASETIVQLLHDYRLTSASREISIEVMDSEGHRLLTVALGLHVHRHSFKPDPSQGGSTMQLRWWISYYHRGLWARARLRVCGGSLHQLE
jgi:hypothetical protein